jgi:hypothetical protein
MDALDRLAMLTSQQQQQQQQQQHKLVGDSESSSRLSSAEWPQLGSATPPPPLQQQSEWAAEEQDDLDDSKSDCEPLASAAKIEAAGIEEVCDGCGDDCSDSDGDNDSDSEVEDSYSDDEFDPEDAATVDVETPEEGQQQEAEDESNAHSLPLPHLDGQAAQESQPQPLLCLQPVVIPSSSSADSATPSAVPQPPEVHGPTSLRNQRYRRYLLWQALNPTAAALDTKQPPAAMIQAAWTAAAREESARPVGAPSDLVEDASQPLSLQSRLQSPHSSSSTSDADGSWELI